MFGCQNSISDIKPLTINYNEVSIDVVEKELLININLIPSYNPYYKNQLLKPYETLSQLYGNLTNIRKSYKALEEKVL